MLYMWVLITGVFVTGLGKYTKVSAPQLTKPFVLKAARVKEKELVLKHIDFQQAQ